jgi:hypothetical protein
MVLRVSTLTLPERARNGICRCQNRIHVTNYICFQRCVLLLAPDQFHEFAAAFHATHKDRAAQIAETFFIACAQEVRIIGDTPPIPKQLLRFIGADKCQPHHATLCWLPPKSIPNASRQNAILFRHDSHSPTIADQDVHKGSNLTPPETVAAETSLNDFMSTSPQQHKRRTGSAGLTASARRLCGRRAHLRAATDRPSLAERP